LKSANVRWDDCEFGAPAIDSKRPYGNSSVFHDIGEILGLKSNKAYEFSNEQEDYMMKIHKETETVLEIILSSGKMEVGTYHYKDYATGWEKI
jgi:hypothetical protein